MGEPTACAILAALLAIDGAAGATGGHPGDKACVMTNSKFDFEIGFGKVYKSSCVSIKVGG